MIPNFYLWNPDSSYGLESRIQVSLTRNPGSRVGTREGTLVPWVPETFLARFPVSVESLLLRHSWLRPTAEDVSAFGQHRKFPPRARKTSGTQGRTLAGCQRIFSFLFCYLCCADGSRRKIREKTSRPVLSVSGALSHRQYAV